MLADNLHHDRAREALLVFDYTYSHSINQLDRMLLQFMLDYREIGMEVLDQVLREPYRSASVARALEVVCQPDFLAHDVCVKMRMNSARATGQYDIVAIVSAMNVAEVNECIEKIRRVDGVTNTNTMIILRSW